MPNVICANCKTEWHVPLSHFNRPRISPICCSLKCANVTKTGRLLAARDTRERRIDKNGYAYIWVEGKRIKEHIALAQKVLGRLLKKGECVHHINFNKADNSSGNLLICTHSYHAWLHQEMARRWALEHLK